MSWIRVPGASTNRAFYLAVGSVVAILVTGILVLALLVSASGPRVRHAVVQNRGGVEGVATVGQGLTLVFDRPVEGADPADAVEVMPETRYTVSQRGQQLSVTFDQNLLSDAEYVLTLEPALEDGAGKRMEGEYRYEFATADPSYTYLERNYGPGRNDQVIERWPLSRESQTLFEADRIESFARGGGHLAVVMPHGDAAADELRVISLENGEDSRVPVPGNVKIESLRASPAGGQLAFVTRANAGPGADGVYREGYDGRLYRHDIAGERLEPVDTLSEKGNAESVLYSNDGAAILYRTLDGAYYLTGAAGGCETIPLGKYGGTGGFDRTGARISFQTRDGAAIYDARTKRLRELPRIGTDRRSSTPTFLRNGDALAYRRSLLDPDTGETTSRVSIVGASGDEEDRIDSPPGTYFFDDPVFSPDDRHALVESAPVAATADDYLSNPQPEGAGLRLYDLSGRESVDEVRGIDPVWNR